MLTANDPAPWFTARSTVNPEFRFDAVGGRYLVLCFFGSAGHPASRRILDDIDQHRDRFNFTDALFLGVSTDPDDERLQRVRQVWPGIITFWDFDGAVSRLYDADQPFTVILNPALRTVAVMPFGMSPENHVPQLLRILEAELQVEPSAGFAPVLAIPGVFEPDFCRTLIGLYEQHGGRETGFMQDSAGQTVRVTDASFKRRSDYEITDPNIMRAAQVRLHRRVVPEIAKAFQFHATRIERHIVVCYDAATGGHFRAHRDNTTRATAHRRFAVTINLNADEYAGGDLRFPEFGTRTYRATTGGAIVFSCALLHEATLVTHGRRYAFLPFLFGEAAAVM